MKMEKLRIEYKNGTVEERIIPAFLKGRVFKELGYWQKGVTTEVARIIVTRA